MELQELSMEKKYRARVTPSQNSPGTMCNDGTLNHASRGKEVTEMPKQSTDYAFPTRACATARNIDRSEQMRCTGFGKKLTEVPNIEKIVHRWRLVGEN